ncbi:response regulator transcription factor [Oerskovia turbata]|uniref:Response regulator transcription factor n=1 Tax=Oerskovia turbata TaxID=1713 RepID=A0A4Q1KS90_9CELL|nr:helix-turn-helix transcriptional regulator [Oerskovia turbata]RXR22395.1 response regulator transcription factor [Oerskovia turbata]RXR32460.1 response regulator transcription factor [Oerskovia turbata]TGJ95858.1 DNA-binding response regulator [Actinotalea fermentans ATCC 43279 = JCM 9966 = DSM 3133]
MSITERTSQSPPPDEVQEEVVLSRRELVVLTHLTEDMTLEQLAAILFVTRNTVKSQLRSIYRKVGVSNRADILRWARDRGIS